MANPTDIVAKLVKMGANFEMLEKQVERLDKILLTHETRISKIEGAFAAMSGLSAIEARLMERISELENIRANPQLPPEK